MTIFHLKKKMIKVGTYSHQKLGTRSWIKKAMSPWYKIRTHSLQKHLNKFEGQRKISISARHGQAFCMFLIRPHHKGLGCVSSIIKAWCKCGWKFCATLQGVSGKVYRAWMGVQRSSRFYLLAKDETTWSCIFPNEKKAGKEDRSQSCLNILVDG